MHFGSSGTCGLFVQMDNDVTSKNCEMISNGTGLDVLFEKVKYAGISNHFESFHCSVL